MKNIKRVRIRNLGLLLMILFIPLTSWAQHNIKGKVIDSEGMPLPGTTVAIQGTTIGTMTNDDGTYSISAPSNGELKFSFIGMLSVIEKIEGRTTIDVSMKEEAHKIDEVVVVGYGTMRKADLTGAVASVKGDKIANVGAFSAAQAMQGKMAGVIITSNGDAGSNPKIRIRGVNTIGNNDPLIVVDGVINGASLQDLNPGDIESIDVLKDASALAIYGSQASSGVILITTKKGNYGEQKLQVNLDASFGIATIPKRLKLVSSAQLVDIIDEARKNENEQLGGSYPLYDAIFPGDNWGRQDITDWQDELFNTGIVQDYSLSAVGGSKKATYAFGISYRNQEGTMPGNFAKRYVLRGSMETKILNDRLKLGSTFNYSIRENRDSNQGDIWSAALFTAAQVPGNIPALFENGKPYQETDQEKIAYFMPGSLYQNNTVLYNEYSNPNHNVASTLFAEFNIMQGLTFKSTLGQNFGQNFYRLYSMASLNPQGGDSSLNVSSNRSVSTSWDNILTFDKKVNGLRINSMVGTNIYNSKWNGLQGYRSGFPNGDMDGLKYLGFGNASTQTNSEDASNVRLASYFGRLNLNYSDKYLLTATIRRDGSSRFHKNARWGSFPSFSLGWAISEESFLRSAKWLDLLKLRASWGQVGNQNVGSDYAYASTVQSGYVVTWGNTGTDQAFGLPLSRHTGRVIYQRGNESVTWETTTMTNLGVDFSVKGISGALEVFKNKTTDILLDAQFPDIAGYYIGRSLKVNAGEVESSGFEFSLNYSNKKGDFGYNIGPNFTYATNKIVSLSTNKFVQGGDANYKQMATSMSRSYVGDPIGAFYGWKLDGMFNTQAEVDAANQNARRLAAINNPQLTPSELDNIYYISPKTAPGDYKFKDVNGDGIITADDKAYLGSGSPKVHFGLNLSCTYKTFDFSMNMLGVTGVKIYSMFEPPLSTPGGLNSLSSIMDHWTPTNHTTNFPRYTMSDPNKNLRSSDKWIHDGSYVRLQNVILGYTLPKDMLSKVGISKVRTFVNVQNLFTLTKYPFLEPEVIGSTFAGGTTDTAAGVDVGSAPTPLTVMLGVNINF